MLERLGVNVRDQTIRTGNIAAGKVTANLAAIGTQGSRIDVTVSALGDAKSRGIGAAVWRSFLTDEYFKSYVKAGGIGLVKEVERALLAQQEIQ